MREIKFRGFSIISKVWVIGSLSVYANGQILITNIEGTQSWLVVPESVGQYTGLKDKNGVEINEGDILKHNNNTYIVKFSDNQFCLLVKVINSETNWRSLEWVNNVQKYIEVIGNIYQNPELLNKIA